jgi:hypothetical protein
MSEKEEPTRSNAFTLTRRQWVGIALFAAALYWLAPVAWRRIEPLDLKPDYRLPYELNNDYWLWSRVAAQQSATHDTVVLGDSVVWGVYVKPGETLSHYLNAQEGRDRYANLGINGAQPVALAGLVEYYGGAIRNKRVLVQCNPLWMNSPKRDLREDAEYPFFHPALTPQFVPSIPCYRETASNRIGKILDRNSSFHGWSMHLQYAYFGEGETPRTIPKWTLEHPTENPLKAVTCRLPAPADHGKEEPISWIEHGITKENMPWVDLAGSLQWKSFLRTVDLLQQRGNTVMVLVGPFNEHLLKDASREKYRALKREIEGVLKEKGIPFLAPDPLPSEFYGDASHPLSAGYALLAKQLVAEGFLAAGESPHDR